MGLAHFSKGKILQQSNKSLHFRMQTYTWKLNYLPSVENDPWSVAEEEHHDNENEHSSNPLIPSLSLGGSDIIYGGNSDNAECEAVEDEKEKEWNESHHDKVGNEKIISAVGVTGS